MTWLGYSFRIALGTIFAALLPLFLVIFVSTRPPKLSPAAPPTTRAWGFNFLLGFARPFFAKRHDWFMDAANASPHGVFSFNLGNIPVVGMIGNEARKSFLTSPSLSMLPGYAKLFAAAPNIEEMQGEEVNIRTGYVAKRIMTLLRPDRLEHGFERMHKIVNEHLHDFGKSGVTDPFESIYFLIFHLTMAQLGPREISEGSRENLAQTMELFEVIETTGKSYMTVLFPWFPTLARTRRLIAAGKLFITLRKFVKERLSKDSVDDDPLQFLIDQGDDEIHIIKFIVGALFAGQVNSGINAAYILLYLGCDATLQQRARQEVESLVERFATADDLLDGQDALECALSRVPLEAWLSELPFMDAILKEAIRFNLIGVMFRKAIGKDVVVGKNMDVISAGAYATYHLANIHRQSEVYPEPDRFNPDRFLDKDAPSAADYTYLGWGAGKHPCIGMRFAKVEIFVIVARFLARFDFTVSSDPEGKYRIDSIHDLPSQVDLNAHSAEKPKVRSYLQYTERK